MQRTPWFERSFDFTLPPSALSGLIERLQGAPVRLSARMATLRADVVTQRMSGKWSILENVGHLIDLEPLWLRRTEQFFEGAADLAPADLTNRRTHDANHNERRAADLVEIFTLERAKLVRLLADAGSTSAERSALHPRLRTPLRLIDHVMFVAEHDEHHLTTIDDLARDLGAQHHSG